MIKEIVTHGTPVHFDELVAYMLLREKGGAKFPGAETARFRTITENDDVEALEKDGNVILLGLGGGDFDEHAAGQTKDKAKECCATLVAKHLGLDEDICWKRILNYTLHTDKNPPKLALDVASTVIRLQQQGMGLQSVYHYAKVTIEAAYQDQKAFTQTTLSNVKEEPVRINGQDSFIAVAQGNDPHTSKYMRYFGACVVVIKNDNEHIQVLSNKEFNLDMRDILRVIRIREQQKNGGIKVADWKILEKEESIPAIPEWYFHRDSNNILNGGASRPDLPKTKLGLEEVVEAVKLGLEGGKECNQCTKPCNLYNLGLLKCRQLRFAAHK